MADKSWRSAGPRYSQDKNGAAVDRQNQRGRGLKLAVRAVPRLLSPNLMLTLAIPLAHLAFLTGDPADGSVSEDTLIARIREQFGFLGTGVTVTIRAGIAHISLPPAADLQSLGRNADG